MGTVREAAEALESALKAMDDVSVYRDPSANVRPPGVVLGPPLLRWEAYSLEPTSARFTVWAVTDMSDRALERLWDLVPKVAAAVDTVPPAVTATASPGVFNAGGTDLPCYSIDVEVGL